jgi:hypothetical protein
MNKEYDLFYGHFGNGISISNRKELQHGDYKKLAHIDSNRKTTFYESLPYEIEQEILNYAKTGNPTISATQNQPVFHN